MEVENNITIYMITIHKNQINNNNQAVYSVLVKEELIDKGIETPSSYVN